MTILRKRHLQAWIAIAILLPVGILVSWLYAPNPLPYTLPSYTEAKLLPVVSATRNGACYTAKLRRNQEGTNWQLEWRSRAPIREASAALFRVTGQGVPIAKNELLGRIESSGQYIFSLKMDSLTRGGISFILYDFIHGVAIDSIHFSK